MINRKANVGYEVTLVTFAVLIFLIAVPLALSFVLFFGEPYDSRDVDALLLNYNLQKCISENKLNIFIEKNELEKEIFNKCSLNQEVIKKDYAIEIKIDGSLIYNSGIDETACALSDKNDNYPKCSASSFSLDSEGKKITVFVLAAANQNSRRF